MKRPLIALALILIVGLAAPVAADDWEEGSLAYEQGDYATALRLWHPYAEAGYAAAQYNLGIIYGSGKGVPSNPGEAAKWFRKAAEQGHIVAQYNLGNLYREGLGVSRDPMEAAKWYSIAADHGFAEAQYNLGLMYTEGEGVPKDYVEAHKWFALAVSGFRPSESRNKAENNLSYIANLMTPEEFAEAEVRASEWRPIAGAGVPNESEATKQVPDARGSSPIVVAQEALRQLGYDPGPSDGIAGPKTRAAVRAFEREHELPETGRITPELIEKITEVWH